MVLRLDMDEVREFIGKSSMESGVFVGCDSFRHRRNGVWVATFVEVVVVHRDSCRGARIFGKREVLPDFRRRDDRLRAEFYRATELWLQVRDYVQDRPSGLHIDFNRDPRYASARMVNEAIGYVRWHTGMEPVFKPDAFAASAAADRLAGLHAA